MNILDWVFHTCHYGEINRRDERVVDLVRNFPEETFDIMTEEE